MDLDQILFSLVEAEFEQSTALLDAPQVPNAPLDRLLAVPAPWVSDAA